MQTRIASKSGIMAGPFQDVLRKNAGHLVASESQAFAVFVLQRSRPPSFCLERWRGDCDPHLRRTRFLRDHQKNDTQRAQHPGNVRWTQGMGKDTGLRPGMNGNDAPISIGAKRIIPPARRLTRLAEP